MKPAHSGRVLSASFVAALIINLALLLLIGALISRREAALISEAKPQAIEFIRMPPKVEEPKPKSKPIEPPEPEPKAEPEPVRPKPKAVTPKPVKRAAPRKSAPKKTPSPSVPAPRIDIPKQGDGPELAPVPGTDSRVTAPPSDWSTDKTEAAASGDGTGAGNSGAGDRALVVLSRTMPRYPRRARERAIEGWVRLEIVVKPNGTVGDARVIDANPKQIFDQAALEAIRRWRFKPTHKDGRAVEQRVVQEISFRLDRRR
ncbi:energy transducer TonB [Methylotuvimicrobium buryatense]|uniref:Protein TonB n=1 Tax=Methylotuvimicrobium buryatense TaxID=95641 RepID=A0A4P9UVD5_METBY|nr:energy transducer TonB [Methylotuvimicrobium buryatense]QCW84593.1 energy transducer TonB [Methylotuvimicrobium buryatense]